MKILTLKKAEKLMDANGKINIYYQNYDAIEELPNSLTELYCGYNELKELPPLPNSLTYLSCVCNNLIYKDNSIETIRHQQLIQERKDKLKMINL